MHGVEAVLAVRPGGLNESLSVHVERRSVRIHCSSVHVISPVKGDVITDRLELGCVSPVPG